VDPGRIGCTGASGGCNQTLYLAALDERVAASAPVCCIGSLKGYLNGAHCVCEMVPGVLRIGEMGDVLSLIAPRPLIIVNGIHDGGAGFQVADMRAQFPKLKRVYELLGAGEKVAKCEIDLGHGYYPPMREVMYAWFRRWLQGIEADLCPEPETKTLPREQLYCLPEGKMPEKYESVPSLVFQEGRRLAATYPAPAELARKETRRALLSRIETEVFGGFPRGTEPAISEVQSRGMVVTTEPGIEVPMVLAGNAGSSSCLMWLSVEGKAKVLESAAMQELLKEGQAVAVPDLRGLGETKWQRANAAGVGDYQLFQNGIVLGRPILGMWVWDALQCLRALRGRFARVSVGGSGAMALVALFAGAMDEAVEGVTCERLLSSFVFPEGFSREHPMSVFMPNLLRYADVPQIAALMAPRSLRILSAVDGGNRELTKEEMAGAFGYTVEVYEGIGAGDGVKIG
jgi:hypothetical protein